jgi:sugar lactone lactonase YvrE
MLYGVDIEGQSIWRFDPIKGDAQLFPLGVKVGCLGIRHPGGFILACERGFGFWDPSTNKLETIAHPEEERVNARFNDGAVDPGGRFWAGTMTSEGFQNSLYRLDSDLTIHQMETGIGISNGMGWSPDGSTMYFTDSPRKLIYAYDFDLESGSIANRRNWVDSNEQDGVPDGLCVDSQGCVWSARWDGWRIDRYDPTGQWIMKIPLPVQRPTSCAFGGDDLKTLYITSALTGLSNVERHKQPHAGDLFILETNVNGQEPYRFQG